MIVNCRGRWRPRIQWALLLPFLAVTLAAQQLPAPDALVPPAQLRELEQQQQDLTRLEGGLVKLLAALQVEGAAARHEAALLAADELRPALPEGRLADFGDLRAALNESLRRLAPEPEPTVVAVLDEQQRWEQLRSRLAARASNLAGELDALRLLRRALGEEANRLENLLLAEHQLKQLARQPDAPPRLARAAAAVVQALERLPPPPQITDRLGLEYSLLADGPAVYLSKEPASRALVARFAAARPDAIQAPQRATAELLADQPATGVSQLEAVAFCGWLAAETGLPVTLPELAHLATADATASCALWSATPWRSADPLELERQERFRVRLVTVWDPGRRLGGERLIGELVSARHPALGFRVSLPAAAIQRQRLAEARANLNLPDATPPPAAAPAAGSAEAAP